MMILQNENDFEDNFDQDVDILRDVKGEKLIRFNTEDLKPLKQFILTFKSPDKDENHKIHIKAHRMKTLKQDNLLENVFTRVSIENLIGKKLLEYEDWHTEKLADTGNLTGPMNNLTLKFEDRYTLDIFDYI